MSAKNRPAHHDIEPGRYAMARRWTTAIHSNEDVERALSERTAYVDTFNRAHISHPAVLRLLRRLS